MKSEVTLRNKIFGLKSILLGGLLVLAALFVTADATAAPTTVNKSKATRLTTSALDPLALRPLWISDSTAARTSSARVTTSVGRRLGVFSAQGSAPLVQVPSRPQPRSPFMPPAPWNR